MPIHGDNHWALIVINIEEKTILYYDSLHNKNKKCIDVCKLILVFFFF